ncbi:hypothetical protein IMZ68_03010 [Candidatus Bathyarchaeota archaeon]|nr:hypothetical protein [Candidatus Bathyarchaeota archaeon]
MKLKTTIIGVLLILNILFVLVPQLIGMNTAEATDRASLQWGTRYYMSQDEQDASYGACVAIKAYFDYYGGYNYVSNYYGINTQQAAVLGNISLCESNYDYATVFYKGHAGTSNFGCGYTHHYIHDNEGGDYQNGIWDFGVGYYTANGKHDFVFLWACGVANEEGGTCGTHGWWGFPASWLHTTNLADNGYTETTDNGPNCYIGFINYSKPFTEWTGYSAYYYRYWCTYFYLHCLRDGLSIKDALDAASLTTMNIESFDDTVLYNGYWFYWDGVNYWSKMWVYGNGDIQLPN